MSIVSKLTESKDFLIISVFYIIVAVLSFVLVPMTGYPPHMVIIGLFSLVAGYSLLMKRSWSLYLVVTMFLIATVFSAYMLYYMFTKDILIDLGATSYLVLTWIATIYVVAKRVKLES